MDLHVYNWEKFERSKLRYIGFSSVFIIAITLSLLNQNIVGGIVLFFILGAYFYYSVLSNQITKIHINDKYILIDKKTHPWSDFSSYTIEVEKKTNKIKNIVLIYTKWYTIYTIKDKEETIQKFCEALDEHIPLVANLEQSLLEKFIRLLKL